MTADEELTEARKEILRLRARIIALEETQWALAAALSYIVKNDYKDNLGQVAEEAREHLDKGVRENVFASELSEPERQFLIQETYKRIGQRLKLGMKPDFTTSEEDGWPFRGLLLEGQT